MSELESRDLVIASFSSLGAAFAAAQLATATMEVQEIFPLGLQGHVIFAAKENLQAFAQKLTSQFAQELTKLVHVPECSGKVLRTYLSVENAEMAQSMLILEAAYVGPLMAIANQAVQKNLQLMDLRMLRGASSGSFLHITSDEASLTDFAASLKEEAVKARLIAQPIPQVRELFSLKP